MQSGTTAMETVKERMKGAWMAGDFGEIAKFSATEAEAFVNRLPIQSGMQVLDVACGTGNLAIPAARRGAVVTGVDIASNLLEQARARAGHEKLQIDFREGDAEQLAFPDAHFDLVLSMFGAMFAPRPDLVSSELVRVCRPDGLIAMANWTPEGFVGKSFALTSRYVRSPEGIPAPVLWGNEDVVRQRFSKLDRHVETVRRAVKFEYPFDSKGVVDLFRRYFGPTQVAFSQLDPSRQSALANDMENLWSEHNQGTAHETVITAEYLEVRVTS
jgi:ubiquinone/menaquinone biosynthesis C-methylase UbiE